MTTQPLVAPPRRLGRSIGAVLAGFAAIVILSLGTDQVFHSLGVYPPWGQRMSDELFLLATAYRLLYSVAGCYLTARFAPRHALILGGIGFVLSLAGAIASLTMDLGPMWYPLALVVTALLCAWLGGALHRQWHEEPR